MLGNLPRLSLLRPVKLRLERPLAGPYTQVLRRPPPEIAALGEGQCLVLLRARRLSSPLPLCPSFSSPFYSGRGHRLAPQDFSDPEWASQLSVLVIDEINRTHLAQVLGEVMYLLEYRDRTIPLAGGGTPFRIPENVYLIGTMNTADRSIALVDQALRRRFAFIRWSCAATRARCWQSWTPNTKPPRSLPAKTYSRSWPTPCVWAPARHSSFTQGRAPPATVSG